MERVRAKQQLTRHSSRKDRKKIISVVSAKRSAGPESSTLRTENSRIKARPELALREEVNVSSTFTFFLSTLLSTHRQPKCELWLKEADRNVRGWS